MSMCNCNQGRLPCTCKGRPVPPAGDVEVPLLHINPVVLPELRGETRQTKGGLTYCGSKPLGSWTVALYEQHVVTRLTAERDGLLAEVERLSRDKDDAVAIVDESDEGLFVDIIYRENGSSLRRGEKLYTYPPDRGYVSRLAYSALQSELTKARELIEEVRKGYEPVLSNYMAGKLLAFSIAHNVDENCGQDAEAAKVNSVTSTIDPYMTAPAVKGESDD